ncbi:MAG: pitrilysin family protein [Myxococcota bacterium]|nr:pitrilysin family protein [Myxococcota bacterium]
MNPWILLMGCIHSSPPSSEATDTLGPRPEVVTPDDFQPVPPETLTLASGADLWLQVRDDIPLVSLALVIPGGSSTDPADQPGLTSLTDTLLLHGAGDRDATTFAAESEQQALELDVVTTRNVTLVTLDAKSDRLDIGLDLLADVVLRPTFAAEEIERVRVLRLGDIVQDLDDPRVLASHEANRLYFGDGHPLAHPSSGTQQGIEAIERSQILSSWSDRFVPTGATFVVTGDFDPQQLHEKLDQRFSDWQDRKDIEHGSIPAPGALEGEDGPRFYLVEKPGSTQSVLHVLMPGPTHMDPESVPSKLGIIALGGTFTSRLNQLLREEKGYTYGARSWPDSIGEHGMIHASSAVRADVTAPALQDLMGELTRIQAGIDAAELEKGKGAVRTRTISALESRQGTVGALVQMQIQGSGPNGLEDELDSVQDASLEQVNQALATMRLDQAIVVVVADPSVAEDLPELTPLPGATLPTGDQP